MKMPVTPQKLATYLDTHLECDCGHEHYASLKAVKVGEGALNELPALVRELGFKHLYLIADAITNKIAGERTMEILNNAGIKATIRVLTHAAFDEATVGELLIHKPADCDVCVAVGTGSINDMTRFFSFRCGLPFITVATAAPMDGFASSIAALNVESLKTTFPAQPPTAIIGDTDILKNAPYSMIAAGLGDLLGKFTCLCDWKLAKIIINEHYCANIVNLTEDCVQNVLAGADKAKDRDPKVIGEIMEGLVLAGVCMSLAGNSRPASGCEHHMSHYWEMMFEQAHKRPAPHGIQVSVATVLVLKLVEALLKRDIDFNAARAKAKAYDRAAWEAEINAAYGPAAPGVIAMENKAKKNDTEGCLARIDAIEANWEEIKGLLANLPKSENVADLLKGLSAPATPAEIEVEGEMLKRTFLYCKEVRDRYTIFQLAWDLGLLDELSDEVIASL